MELQQTESERIEFAIQRRLEDTRTTTGFRPFRPATRSRPAFGPRLVKPGQNPVEITPLLPAEKSTGKFLHFLSASKARRQPTANVLPIRPEQTAKVDERVLLVMAALGPLYWLTHAALTWLHIIKK